MACAVVPRRRAEFAWNGVEGELPSQAFRTSSRICDGVSFGSYRTTRMTLTLPPTKDSTVTSLPNWIDPASHSDRLSRDGCDLHSGSSIVSFGLNVDGGASITPGC